MTVYVVTVVDDERIQLQEVFADFERAFTRHEELRLIWGRGACIASREVQS